MDKDYQKKRSAIVKAFHLAIAPFLEKMRNPISPASVKVFLIETKELYDKYRNDIEALGPPGYFGSYDE